MVDARVVKVTFAITGEIDLQGNVTEIGGLDLKILGGIRAGVDTFIFPESNTNDFDKFYEEQKDKSIFNNITFVKAKHIKEVLDIVFV